MSKPSASPPTNLPTSTILSFMCGPRLSNAGPRSGEPRRRARPRASQGPQAPVSYRALRGRWLPALRTVDLYFVRVVLTFLVCIFSPPEDASVFRLEKRPRAVQAPSAVVACYSYAVLLFRRKSFHSKSEKAETRKVIPFLMT